ncbi:hypothetical protein H0H93_013773 [Arthromyces matolae]|nr:hypothetical protein H0H93_013773 [Arthromyces matolae]
MALLCFNDSPQNQSVMNTTLTLSILAFGTIIARWHLLRRKARLPPGPRGWPIIGNLFDFPKQTRWITFSQWGEIYGPVYSLTIFGQPIVILNSLEAAQKIMNEKGNVYSDRPQVQMGGELIGWKNGIPLLRHGETWQLYRKRFHQLFGTHAANKAFHDQEVLAVKNFLRDICENSGDLIPYIKKHVGSIVLGPIYGYEVTKKDDQAVHLLDVSMENFAIVAAPFTSPVDMFPPLRYLPSWFPGAGFHSEAERWTKILMKMALTPFLHVKDKLASLEHPSFLSAFLRPDLTEGDLQHIILNASSIAAGGFSTRLSMIHAFFLLMAAHPEVQAKAQAEIEKVVGVDRFPTFDDRVHLTYVNALCKEVLRFHSVVPNGLPHLATEDGIYEGYLIPKGSTLIDIRNMLHDPNTYKDPFAFNPSRFITSEGHTAEKDVYDFVFGFGRRACPGRVLADESLFIIVAMSLAVLDVSRGIDKDGKMVKPVFQPLSGVVSQPTPFECSIKIRNPESLVLLNSHKFE